MDDFYERSISDNNTFLLGYRHDRCKAPSGISFLFKTFRFVHILKGSALWNVANESIKVEKDDILFFNNISSRRIAKVLDGTPFEYAFYAFPPEIIKDSPDLLKAVYSKKYIHIKNGSYLNKEISETLAKLYSIIKNDSPIPKKLKRPLITSLLHSVSIYLVSDVLNSGQNNIAMKNSHISGAIADSAIFIQNNFSTDLSVPMLADKIHMSSGYFCRVFKDYIGVSVNVYINNCRIEHFCQLIANKNTNILDAALECGYKSSAGFYKAFSKIKGMSPKEYLKNKLVAD